MGVLGVARRGKLKRILAPQSLIGDPGSVGTEAALVGGTRPSLASGLGFLARLPTEMRIAHK